MLSRAIYAQLTTDTGKKARWAMILVRGIRAAEDRARARDRERVEGEVKTVLCII